MLAVISLRLRKKGDLNGSANADRDNAVSICPFFLYSAQRVVRDTLKKQLTEERNMSIIQINSKYLPKII